MNQDISLKSIILEDDQYILKNINYNQNKCGSILYAPSDGELLNNFIKNIHTNGFNVIINRRDSCNYYQEHLIILLSEYYTLSIKRIDKTKASIFINFSNDLLNMGRTNTTFNFKNSKDFFDRVNDITTNQLKRTAHINEVIKYKLDAFLEYLEEEYNNQNFYNLYFD